MMNAKTPPSSRLAPGCALIILGLLTATATAAPATSPPAPGAAQLEPLNLATLICAKYEDEILNPDSPAVVEDPINVVMWLLGFSVAKSGEHFMYGNALTSFGFALDAECKNHPASTLLAAVQRVTVKRDKPMDLTTLTCATFEARHAGAIRTDRESAATIMMWLFGYSVGSGGGHTLDLGASANFESTLNARCAAHPDENMFNALTDVGSTQPHA